jgi:hypothetical protein
MEDEWPWNICGGLIGGARGSRSCTKPFNDPRHTHCGVVWSHTVHKAPLEEGHGCIPNVILSIVSLENVKAEYIGQVKPLEVALEDVVADLYEPEASYNKVIMEGFSGKSGEDGMQVQAQYRELAAQVKLLRDKGMGSLGVDVSDPAITSLKADVSGLLADNRTIKASLGGEIVKIDNEAFHSADEVKEWIVDCVGPSAGTYEIFF